VQLYRAYDDHSTIYNKMKHITACG